MFTLSKNILTLSCSGTSASKSDYAHTHRTRTTDKHTLTSVYSQKHVHMHTNKAHTQKHDLICNQECECHWHVWNINSDRFLFFPFKN